MIRCQLKAFIRIHVPILSISIDLIGGYRVTVERGLMTTQNLQRCKNCCHWSQHFPSSG